MGYWQDKWNVPGQTEYEPEKPVDVVVRSREDQELRGYWLARTSDGQACFVSNNNAADGVTIDVDLDGTPVIKYTDETSEFSYTTEGTVGVIRVKRYG